MSNLLNIKDQNGNWIPIPVVTNGIKTITQNNDYTLTITLNDGTTYTTSSIKGEDGQDYVLTENDKQDIAGLVDTPVDDVQINGTSIVTDGVAEIPIGDDNTFGVFKTPQRQSNSGITAANGILICDPATTSEIKNENQWRKPISVGEAYSATFYGLARASGDRTQKLSSNPVGTYTEEAKTAIRTMLGLQDVYDDYSSALTALGVI